MALRRIGQILIDLGFLTEDRVKLILEEQRQRPTELFGQVAIGMGLLSDEHLVQGLGEQMGLHVIALADLTVQANVLAAAAAALEKGVLDLTGVEALADSAPVRKLLNMVLLMAIKDHASDL